MIRRRVLRHYAVMKKVLKASMDVEPGPETAAAVDALKIGRRQAEREIPCLTMALQHRKGRGADPAPLTQVGSDRIGLYKRRPGFSVALGRPLRLSQNHII